MRLLNANQENFRLQPRDGSLIQNDPDLTPSATTTVVGAAYDRNVATAMATTLFAIDRSGNELVRIGGVDGIPSPIDGEVTSIGPLGFTLHSTLDAGFDISGESGVAYAALTSHADSRTHLYTINLSSGAATDLGMIGNGQSAARTLTVVPPEPPTGEQGPAGPQGSAGPQGPARPQGSPGSGLATALASASYTGARAGRSRCVWSQPRPGPRDSRFAGERARF